MAEVLCLACEIETKSGAQGALDSPDSSPVASLLKSIVDKRLSGDSTMNVRIISEAIFSADEKYICRPCFGKYQ